LSTRMDTKMEMQGLSDAQNIHSQHGALYRTTSSATRPTLAPSPQLISVENEADRPLELSEPQSDSNNNPRPKTTQFRLLAEDGNEVARSPATKQSSATSSIVPEDRTLLGLHNMMNAEKENVLVSLLGSHEFNRTEWKYEENREVMQMALPLFEGEAEAMPQRQLTLSSPVLREQREDGALKQPPGDSIGTVNAAVGSRNLGKKADRQAQDLYVLFNTGQEDGAVTASKTQADRSCDSGSTVKGKGAECCGSMEASNSRAALCESADSLRCPDMQTLKKAEHVISLLTDNPAVLSAKQGGDHRTVEDVVLTNKYGDKICGQICTENSVDRLLRETRPDLSSLLISEAAGVVEAMEKSAYFTESAGVLDGSHPVTSSSSPSAGETFSGTITINNQSIIVTIENGVLTLAAPPEGHVHKEDDMVSLKEHLGMKDYEDIVLLNYDSGTKSIGKISTLAVASSNPQEEPRPGLSVSDSELALVDDCSLSEMGTSLDSCSVVKQEAGVLCAVTEADLISPSPRTPVGACENEDLNSLSLIRSKKDTVATFACPEPGCSSTFESRQKLKQRPHTCEFEGCGRRFTTVYNLKAHLKVHEQDNAFICEVCNEKFRSATRLTNHQRVHFAPQRPHKCEFPGRCQVQCWADVSIRSFCI
ncbi:hypothetical protein GOODEAATRI_025416, partial [Goodea atripinnis]